MCSRGAHRGVDMRSRVSDWLMVPSVKRQDGNEVSE
jgi:hypothetical protein|eukprot:COSAG01_NODE_4459_length_5004_cov_24.561060_3_plen_36_part_00